MTAAIRCVDVRPPALFQGWKELPDDFLMGFAFFVIGNALSRVPLPRFADRKRTSYSVRQIGARVRDVPTPPACRRTARISV